jgi:DNA repair exonuclease SbcCD nuclease subunit
MAVRPFRFLHAADLHLERPFAGVAEVPEPLRERLIDAPYVAASRLFDLAISEAVDFVVLSGDVADVRRAGPRAMAFLVGQFQRLAAKNIHVYWAGGEVDPPSQWPAALTLPRHVHLFAAEHAETVIHQRDGQPLARLTGMSRAPNREPTAADFRPIAADVPTVAAAHVAHDLAGMEQEPVAYWALGGDHARRTLFASPGAAHYPGTPQGHTWQESGPRGATLVDVDDTGRARMVFQAVDAVRWVAQTVVLEPETDRAALAQRLREEVGRLAVAASDRAALVHFTLAGGGPVRAEIRRAGAAEELAAPLRDEFGHRDPPVWTVDIDVEPAAVFPAALYDQDSILGDYLRLLGDLQNEPPSAALEKLLPASAEAPGVAGVGRSPVYVMRRAAELGIDLLQGEAPVARSTGTRGGVPQWEVKP